MRPVVHDLFTDIPTQHRVIRDGRKRVVFARHDWEGNFLRYVTHVSKAERDRRRAKEYRGAAVGLPSWTNVELWEIGQE